MNKSLYAIPFTPSFWAFLLLLSLVPAVNAASLESLINEKELSVAIRLQSTPPIIANQAVLIEVEVATRRWFAKGTRLINPSIKDVVMLPVRGMAINSSKKIDGVTWASQIREITLYPTRAGRYQLPPIEIEVSVNTEKYGVVEGRVVTAALDFSVIIPPALERLEDYIVSPDVQLDIDEEQAEKDHYAVGEAIVQTISLSAINVPGMMLPALSRPQIDGLSIYRKPPQLNDKSSRGELTGIRTESFTYIFEKPGQYKIPEQIFYWWNMETQELSELTVPAREWSVTGSSFTKLKFDGMGYGIFPILRALMFVVLALAVIWFIYVGYRSRIKLLAYYAKLTNLAYRTQRKAFLQSVDKRGYPLACEILYQIINDSNEQVCSLKDFYAGQARKSAALENLLVAAYGSHSNDILVSYSEMRLLLETIPRKKVDSNISLLSGGFRLNPKG